MLDERQAQPGPDLPALLTAASEGDESAWRSIIHLYSRRVYALAKSRLCGGGRAGQDLAEEVTQSVFVTVATKLTSPGTGAYTEQGKFESWLFRIAMNRIRDEVRRARRQAEPTDPDTFRAMPGPTPAEGGADSDTPRHLEALRTALEQLSDADREIVELRHHAEMSFKQMADLLSEPIGTLLARHHRALRKLKDLMTGQAEPSGQGALE